MALFKRLSQDGGWADFSEILCAFLFKNVYKMKLFRLDHFSAVPLRHSVFCFVQAASYERDVLHWKNIPYVK
jgi:hypothetical protein